jgi:hypothetical protein
MPSEAPLAERPENYDRVYNSSLTRSCDDLNPARACLQRAIEGGTRRTQASMSHQLKNAF